MKKFLAMMLCVFLIGSLAACAANGPDTGNVGAVKPTEVSAEILEALGMSAEEFAAMPAEQQQAILDEMGAVLDAEQKEEQPQEPPKAETPEDPTASGNYVVVLGDYMNSITLYYENGVLVKIVESFQKNSEEEAECAEYTGDALAEYSFNFIDWDNASLQDILDGMADYGNFGQYQIRSAE